MDYYSRKAAFHREIKKLVYDAQNFNKRFSISMLEIDYSGRFGFNKNTIIKAFQPFEKIGRVEILEHHILIREKKISEIKPVDNTAVKPPDGVAT